MDVAVVVPYQPETKWRELAWQWVRRRYAELHPGWPVIVAEPDGAWSKGSAVARGLRATTAEIVVVADADSFVAAAVLADAVARAGEVAWVMPHSRVWRLSINETRRLIARPPVDLVVASGRRYQAPVGGGIVVARRDVLENVPLDPRFEGWGGEDISWGWALSTLIGAPLELGGDLWHLWHVPAATRRRAYPATNALAGRYRDAVGDRRAMLALIDEISA